MKSKAPAMRLILLPIIWAAHTVTAVAAPNLPVPEKIPAQITDRQDFQIPDRVQLSGWTGRRAAASITNRLEQVDLDKLLDGFRHRPGRQAWDGEHAGKWLHAATLEWVNSSDPLLRTKLDYVAVELAQCQTDEGYLGTYIEAKRWTSWDVWSHKYNLLGLLAYVRYTGNTNLLATCRRMGDLLCEKFGDEPGQRDIIKAGEHVGMAPTSVLEPMVLLYRLTGEPRYLDFCKYILRAWEQPNGPHIISTLLAAKRVDKVANGKAYEMLSCLNGALEFYRTTGDKKILEACLNAWQDIVDHRIYLTGAMSYREHFHGDFDLPNFNNVGETCVTVTWLQFNAQLLRLTGEARFADQLERVILNQLLGAQSCDGSGWGYYVQMEGRKPYSRGDDAGGVFNCCLSSGPRGLALIPTFAVTTDADGVVVNLYEAGRAELQLRSGAPVEIKTETLFPGEDNIRITVSPATRKTFAVKLRIPSWCGSAKVEVNGKKVEIKIGGDGYAKIHRAWNPGDKLELNLKQEARLIVGDHKNQNKVALLYGPLVLAADEAGLLADAQTRDSFFIAGTNLNALALTPESAPANLQTWPGTRLARINAVSRKDGSPVLVHLMSFAEAGGAGSNYQVWLPLKVPDAEDAPDAANAARASAAALTVMTYNLRFASATPPNAWPARRPIMRELIRQLAPDVMGTQEGVYSQLQELAADLPEFDWIGLGREGGSRGEFMAVFYRRARLEPLAYDHFWLSETPDVMNSTTWGNSIRRMVTWVKFRDRTGGNEFFVFNTHFDHQVQAAREKSAELVRARIAALNPKLPVLLIGDFNAVAGANKAYDILTGENFLADAWLEAAEKIGSGTNTFNGFQSAVPKGERIDWILTRGGVTTERAAISTFQRDGQFPSDHFPVVVRLRLPSGKKSGAAVKPAGQIIRINAGAEIDFTDADGNVWLSDRGFDGGEVSLRDAELKIENTKNPTLYRSEHWGMTSFSQALPNGKYVVKLHFAETWEGVTGPGGRVFSVTVEGRLFKDMDVWLKSGGGQRAYVEEVNTTIADGKLDIVFEAGVDNPEINGIEIIPVP